LAVEDLLAILEKLGYQRAVFLRGKQVIHKHPRDIAQRIRRSLDDLATNPNAEHLDVTKLQNRPGYRLRVGDRRVIYEIENDGLIILVLRMGPRG
jgi:mRNA interferase RelE/StbE